MFLLFFFTSQGKLRDSKGTSRSMLRIGFSMGAGFGSKNGRGQSEELAQGTREENIGGF